MVRREHNRTDPSDAESQNNLLKTDLPFVDAKDLNILWAFDDPVLDDPIASDNH